MVEQLPRGDRGSAARVGEPQLRNVGADRGVEVEPARGGQPDRRRGGERLGDRRQVEGRVLVDRPRVGEAGDTVRGVAALIPGEDAGGHPGHAVLLGDLGELLLEHGILRFA